MLKVNQLKLLKIFLGKTFVFTVFCHSEYWYSYRIINSLEMVWDNASYSRNQILSFKNYSFTNFVNISLKNMTSGGHRYAIM
jgi:hypothetical protein